MEPSVIDQIKELSIINSELCQRIKQTNVVHAYCVQLTLGTKWQFSIKENILNNHTTSINHPPPLPSISIQLDPIIDLFNDRLNYVCNSLEDVVRLNRDMLPIALKYDFLGNSAKSNAELSKFLKNYQLINESLVQTEKNLQPLFNQHTFIRESIETINEKIRQLREYESIVFETKRDRSRK